jgi:copper chaperone CopZ
MTTTTYSIDGMTCDGCVASLRLALGRLQDAEVESVAIGRATVRHRPGAEGDVIAAVEDAGFDVVDRQTHAA